MRLGKVRTLLHLVVGCTECWGHGAGSNGNHLTYSTIFYLQESAITPNKAYTVRNLQIGTEYCVQVHTKINVNQNARPSAWTCTFTSSVEPSRGELNCHVCILKWRGAVKYRKPVLFWWFYFCQNSYHTLQVSMFGAVAFIMVQRSKWPEQGTNTVCLQTLCF